MVDEQALTKAKRYAAAVREMMDAKEVFLFGSHARGTATRDSDIDIAVIVDHVLDNYLEEASKLWHLCWNISDEIEPVLLTPADAASGFLQTVRKTGVAL